LADTISRSLFQQNTNFGAFQAALGHLHDDFHFFDFFAFDLFD
jgi:hypothetical protein